MVYLMAKAFVRKQVINFTWHVAPALVVIATPKTKLYYLLCMLIVSGSQIGENWRKLSVCGLTLSFCSHV